MNFLLIYNSSWVFFVFQQTLGIAETEITPDANLVKDLGIDSLDYTELVMEFEQALNIRIPDEDAVLFVTVSFAIEYIQEKIDS